eukprot:Protomagalhaensia_sp_Gyna_25__277@NODE_1130_length_2158_cov_27_274658_g897_i0_p1_GENE_NODE_1130_length_2158_cov_27_274658_g897_i0NODE_1130_length_2158_cov_27_274658_g897_i0_p1_ORF_typecomplete_len530_score32_29Pkinase/PF00069_25/0_00022Pkinase/PF00069_25/1_9e02Pkinase/PF00069_25/12Pkinase_Tyr/PF07714_17/0_00075Pkinase_Tyr/PF07714_17/41Kinaselike/PF14531_6/0_17Kinaselike/PF14531_6/6_9e03Kinaselike/PF14531_6/67_NODE_1130_length_2158_cov_27_274658_g897_i01841773
MPRPQMCSKLESIRDDDELERTDKAFYRELILLTHLHSALPNEGVVRLLGWGIAENYLGYLVESLAGPPLSEVLNGKSKARESHLWKVHPPCHLQLLYRLHWAMQLTRITYDFHCRNVVQRDMRVEYFSFRSSPSPHNFGEVVLTNISQARFRKPHPTQVSQTNPPVPASQPMVPSSKVPSSPSAMKFSHPCMEFHAVGALELRYMAEVLLEEYSPLWCSEEDEPIPCNEGDLPSGLYPFTQFGSGRQSLQTLLSRPGMCLHWPACPPRAATTPMYAAPEVAFCESSKQCPLTCKAEHLREKARHRNKGLLKDHSLLDSGQISRPERNAVCGCPLCACHESRCDVWSLGLVLGVIFQVFEFEGPPRVEICNLCGQRRTLNDGALESWLSDVGRLIEGLSLTGATRKDRGNDSAEKKLKGDLETSSPGKTAVSWLLDDHQSTADTWTGSPSTQASACSESSGLQEQAGQWREISEFIKVKVLDSLYWSTEIAPVNRVSVKYLKETFEMLFDILYEFYMELHLPQALPARG